MRHLEQDGQTYWFRQREDMEREIKNGEFLEYGEHNGHLYGTHFDSIHSVINSGKMCILDCSPSSLKLLYNSTTFLPYVVFIAAPGMDQLRNLNYSSRNLQVLYRYNLLACYNMFRCRILFIIPKHSCLSIIFQCIM